MQRFIDAGHTITHDWTRLTVPQKATDRIKQLVMSYAAKIDMEGVRRADVVILFLPGKRGSHGEFTMGLGLDKICILVGKPEIDCMVHWHPDIIKCKNVSEALKVLEEKDKSINRDLDAALLSSMDIIFMYL